MRHGAGLTRLRYRCRQIPSGPTSTHVPLEEGDGVGETGGDVPGAGGLEPGGLGEDDARDEVPGVGLALDERVGPGDRDGRPDRVGRPGFGLLLTEGLGATSLPTPM